jgi:hypothetical protein
MGSTISSVLNATNLTARVIEKLQRLKKNTSFDSYLRKLSFRIYYGLVRKKLNESVVEEDGFDEEADS